MDSGLFFVQKSPHITTHTGAHSSTYTHVQSTSVLFRWLNLLDTFQDPWAEPAPKIHPSDRLRWARCTTHDPKFQGQIVVKPSTGCYSICQHTTLKLITILGSAMLLFFTLLSARSSSPCASWCVYMCTWMLLYGVYALRSIVYGF